MSLCTDGEKQRRECSRFDVHGISGGTGSLMGYSTMEREDALHVWREVDQFETAST